MEDKMFCYQCQETAKGKGCTQIGVCGKTPEVAAMQDLLVYVTKGISEITTRLRKEGKNISKEINYLITRNLFITITNANFDIEAIIVIIKETMEIKESLLKEIIDKTNFSLAATWYEQDIKKFYEMAKNVGILSTKDEDRRSLNELIIYGLKGLSAYSKHANVLGKDNEKIDVFLQATLAKTLNEDMSIGELVELVVQTGRYGVEGMVMLDNANTSTYGHPEITVVNIGVGTNPGILISGHDLKDIQMLLQQTEGTGIDVYTHSEMLASHYYPELKKYSHLRGNYGNAWWKQKEEFESFNGPILMTTNCIVPPKDTYKDRIYTTGTAGFTGCKHIGLEEGKTKDFSDIISHAKKCKAPTEIESGEIIGGFAHDQLIKISDSIVEAVNSGLIKKFVVMAGCDGRVKSRNYYSDFAKSLPQDSVILTAGCAKYKYNKLDLGSIGNIPRVLDAGQCNDSYSLVFIALKLKEIFNLEDINELPIVYNIAWYEQKAVIVLLSLLYLGVKNIHLGPTLPAFLSPNITNVLVQNFGISQIGTVEEDLNTFFG